MLLLIAEFVCPALGFMEFLSLLFKTVVDCRVCVPSIGLHGVYASVVLGCCWLLIEEFVCPALGFMEFLHVDWLAQIIEWQRPSGCYSAMRRKTSFHGIVPGDDSKYEYVDDNIAETGRNAAAAINPDVQQAIGNVAVDETVGRLPELAATHPSLNRFGNVDNPEVKRPSNEAGPIGQRGMLGNATTGRQLQWLQEQRGRPLHQVPLHDVPGGARKLSGFKTRRLLVEQTLPGNHWLYVDQASAQMRAGACNARDEPNANAQHLNQMQMLLDQMQLHLDQMRMRKRSNANVIL